MKLSVLTKKQTRIYGPLEYRDGGHKCKITAEVRHDDCCGNGHNSFSITADIDVWDGVRWREHMGGCCHDEIAKHFPELAPFIKWHLCDTDGPMHYISNVLYHAGDRDHWGLRKGEASNSPRHQETRLRFGNSPMTHKFKQAFTTWLEAALKFNAQTPQNNSNRPSFVIVPVKYAGESDHKFEPKFTYEGYTCKWHECPFDNMREAREFDAALKVGVEFVSYPTLIGEGKERQLDYARSSAVWPEATDEQLCAEPAVLKAALEARLPALLEAFQKDVESLGLVW